MSNIIFVISEVKILNNIYIPAIFIEKLCSKPLECNVVYVPIYPTKKSNI